jgi:hypothetical protein
LTEVFDPTYEDAVVLALFILDVLLRFAAVLQTWAGPSSTRLFSGASEEFLAVDLRRSRRIKQSARVG